MKIDQSLFTAGQHALNEAYGACPKCDGELRIKYVNKSSFLSCSNYPKCDFTQSTKKAEVSTLKVMDGSSCPECSSELAVKKGRYGMFIGCTSFPECHYIASQNKNESDDVSACPKCKIGNLVKRQNKFGKTFIACDAYPKCKHIENPS